MASSDVTAVTGQGYHQIAGPLGQAQRRTQHIHSSHRGLMCCSRHCHPHTLRVATRHSQHSGLWGPAPRQSVTSVRRVARRGRSQTQRKSSPFMSRTRLTFQSAPRPSAQSVAASRVPNCAPSTPSDACVLPIRQERAHQHHLRRSRTALSPCCIKAAAMPADPSSADTPKEGDVGAWPAGMASAIKRGGG
jgi:hypothetical protein